MTYLEALHLIYHVTNNGESISTNLKNFTFIKNILNDSSDLELSSTTIAMLSKYNFMASLYQAKDKTVEANVILSKLSAYFNEELLIEILNFNLVALHSKPIEKNTSQPVLSNQQNDLLDLINLDNRAFNAYENAKKDPTTSNKLLANQLLGALDQKIKLIKQKDPTFQFPNLHIKRPTFNQNYLKKLNSAPQVYSPPVTYPNYYSSSSKEFDLLPLDDPHILISIILILIGLSSVAIFIYFQNIWTLGFILFLISMIGLIISFFYELLEYDSILIPHIIIVIGATIVYLILGPNFGIAIQWVIGLVITFAISIIALWLNEEKNTFLMWLFLCLGYFIILGLAYFTQLDYFIGILSIAYVLSTILASLITIDDYDGLSWLTFIFPILYGIITYLSFSNQLDSLILAIL